MSDFAETVEIATLDKEMAEEKVMELDFEMMVLFSSSSCCLGFFFTPNWSRYNCDYHYVSVIVVSLIHSTGLKRGRLKIQWD